MCAYAATTPTLYFSDLTSGPVGSIVTVYGNNIQGSVTLNGVSAAVVSSSSTKISFKVPSTTSGSIVVAGSNALPFTVRAGQIYYVATNGSNSNSGSQSSPWATIPYAFNAAACGDVIYAMNGVSQTGLDNYNASLSVTRKCSESTPLALVGYPGATVTIGSTGLEFAIRNPDINGDGYNGIVLANLVLRASNTAIKDVNNSYWRIVGNDMSCPNGGGQAACAQFDYAQYIQFLGNSIHDTGAGGTKYYHSFYATSDTVHVQVGWNHIFNNNSCRGIQFYSTGGSPQYDLVVHDNIVSGQQCDGINFSTVDATLGPVEAYNNLVYHVGVGGPNLNSPNEACIASLGYGAPGGQLLVYGNTMADCGSAGGSTAGAITVQSGSPTVVVKSNLVMQNASEAIYSPNTNQSLVAADHNVLLNSGTAGVVDSNYHPVSGSPAIGAGTAYSGMTYDLAGLRRPQSGSEDAGAYLFSTSAAAAGPTATLSTTSLDFGTENVGTQSGWKNVTLSNSGSSPLAISSIALGGTNPYQFTSTNNCGSSVAAGQSCIIQAQFDPTASGAKSAAIAVNSNATNPQESIALAGTAVTSGPAVTLNPTSINFGNQNVGTASAAQTVSVTNSGSMALNISGISVTGTNPTAFVVTNGCSATLAAGSSCAVQVKFAPGATGTKSASLAIADNATGSPQTVALSGNGATSAPVAAVSPASIDFGTGVVGTTSTAQTVTVKNSGTATLNISSISLTGANPLQFKVTNSCATTLAAGASCAIKVQFAPTATGTKSASLSVADDASGSPQIVALSGNAVAQTTSTTTVHYSVNNLYFYNEPVGTSGSPRTIIATNTGSANFTVSGISMTGSQPNAFSATSNCTGVAPKASCTISVTFTPKVTGTNSATMVITGNGGTASFPLTGRGY